MKRLGKSATDMQRYKLAAAGGPVVLEAHAAAAADQDAGVVAVDGLEPRGADDDV
jgi:hypothetical protein